MPIPWTWALEFSSFSLTTILHVISISSLVSVGKPIIKLYIGAILYFLVSLFTSYTCSAVFGLSIILSILGLALSIPNLNEEHPDFTTFSFISFGIFVYVKTVMPEEVHFTSMFSFIIKSATFSTLFKSTK